MYFGLLLPLSLLVAVVVGAILGWVAFDRVTRLKQRVDLLEQRLARAAGEPQAPAPAPTLPDSREAEPAHAATSQPAAEKARLASTAPPRWLTQLKDHWMIWLGGLCVALAGIFLVKYSIDRGLLGPTARILLAVLTGLALHAVAEWLRRRTGASHPAFAALAGGASITLYAAMLAALHLYHLLDARLVFLLLAAIALATMALSLAHGPVLAIIGLFGGYVVPVLVSSDSGNILTAMLYSLIISGSALLLTRWVYRSWLWFGVLAGGLGWWLLSMPGSQAEGFRGVYLAALAYGMLAIPTGDWSLSGVTGEADRGAVSRSRFPTLSPLALSLLLLTLAQACSIARESFFGDALLRWSPLVIVLLLASRRRPTIAFLPWLSLVSQWFAWLYCGMAWDGAKLQLQGLSQATQDGFLLFAAGMSALYSGITL